MFIFLIYVLMLLFYFKFRFKFIFFNGVYRYIYIYSQEMDIHSDTIAYHFQREWNRRFLFSLPLSAMVPSPIKLLFLLIIDVWSCVIETCLIGIMGYINNISDCV